MEEIEIVFLTGKETMSVGLTEAEIMELVRNVLISHSDKNVELPPKIGVHPYKGAISIAMPAFVKNMGALGCKWISDSPRNYARGLPYLTGIIVVNDPETCVPLAIMDASWITKVRTAAATGLAAKYLGRHNSKTMGVIGAGVQGTSNGLAICKILHEVSTIKVFDTRCEAVKRFASEFEKSLGRSVKIIPAESIERAVVDSDVVVTATSGVRDPIVSFEWFKEGVFYVAIDDWTVVGLDAVLKFDKFVTDDWEQTRSFMLMESARCLPKLHAQLGDIIAGKKKGRENEFEKIMDNNLGLAILDVTLAKRVYELAKANCIGHNLRLEMCN
jgi:ornithine cyclodeaminase/alanine dehydrogenase